MFVFREGRRAVPGRPLLDTIVAGLNASSANSSDTVELLLRAGELECALADLGSRDSLALACVTDALAANIVCCRPLDASELIRILGAVDVPSSVTVSPPEGFSYYALHPLNYADLVAHTPVQSAFVAIIGIRSIGTTLGAVVKAALEQRGVRAERTTVRPHGHPFNRETQLTREQLVWVSEWNGRGAQFFVVDEGPGLSGSSFLSVGGALAEASVPRARISFLCSREPEVSSLVADQAATRWPMYRAFYVQPNDCLPDDAKVYVAGGIWRAHFIGDESYWPASWTQTERLKFLSRDQRHLYKFEGLGRFGAEVRERAALLADGGFGLTPEDHQEGFVEYSVVAGRVLREPDLSTGLLDRMARYCAFRAAELRVSRMSTPLAPMVQFNVTQEFGTEPGLDADAFAVERPVITDSHLLPHEWLRRTDGSLVKLDAINHGDDHFYPGPTDIAWDLAGAIVEWNMEPAAQEYFIAQYRSASGHDPRPRLGAYRLAYTMFRLGFCKMAAEAMRGSDEEPRLTRAYQRYRKLAETELRLTRNAQRIEVAPGQRTGAGLAA